VPLPVFHFCVSIADSAEMSVFEALAGASAALCASNLQCATTPPSVTTEVIYNDAG
jgi:hypothetical protein